ncbi:DUF4292 domain-containing protein [Botryobacter ruber]|uniref:DUF4292 domain-containing protein n=1 Tax=Botryobacter ruber TaxID=2171629 RepID=UPI000E0AF565|nr:DUF4292 domain-containing protein [Botryobacter ruber]
MNKPLLLFLLGLLILSSCKKEAAPVASATTETVGSVTVQNLDFDYLSARSQLKVEDNNGSQSSGMSLRIRKDSIIWASILPGLGIEAARIKITQDSVFVVNRMRKEYIATDYDYLRNKFKVDLNYDILQAILLGNYLPNPTEKVMQEAELQHVQQLRNNLLFEYIIGLQNQKLVQLNVNDKQTGNTINVSYNNFQPVGPVPVAYGMEAQVVQAKQTSTFTLNHSRITVASEILDFPFTVPADYKRL